MTLLTGTRLGPYEILSPLGAGGMGEVYRAKDMRLDRTVAIKVLPSHFASDPDRRQRFEREARAVSSLNHPHICTLYDIGHQDGVDFLVMEYLEGETLDRRLSKGLLPNDQVLRCAVEIADALDKAHRQGIIHRDLKPGNIMLTKSGAKLLDFGLAKLRQAESGAAYASLSALPTEEDRRLTGEGTILGTFQYMAPEQLEGKEADARTDIFAFGVVVYEMVTGKKAFEGKSQASLIAAILEHDPPPISSLQPMTPPALDRVVKTCLAKDPDERWQSAHDLAKELKWITEGDPQVGMPALGLKGTPARRRNREWFAWTVAAAALTVAFGAIFVAWRLQSPIPSAPRLPMRFQFSLPALEVLAVGESLGSSRHSLALSPDGSTLVYVAYRGGRTQLYLRPMNRLQSTPIVGTEDGTGPFFSPDGQWVGFFTSLKLKKASLAGGAPVVLCDAAYGRGASWGRDDTIIFAPDLYSGLYRISASGGAPSPVTTVDVKQGERNHRWPEILPGGKAILFTVGIGTSFDDARIVVQRLDMGERRTLVEGGTNPRYLPSGHLVYARAGSLFAVPFDLADLKVTGHLLQVLEDVRIEESGAAQFSYWDNGTLFYVARSAVASVGRMFWADRKGIAKPVPLQAEFSTGGPLRLSPDGQHVVYAVRTEIWIYDLTRGASSRLTSGIRANRPIWSPDGRRIVFGSEKHGPWNLFWKAADGTGEEEQLLSSPLSHVPSSFTPDGKVLMFTENNPQTGMDIWALSLEDRKARPVLRTSFNEDEPMISSDGRWLAYTSDESGRKEIYVVPFPAASGKWLISNDGGAHPVWARNGKELFYRNGEKMMSVSIAADRGFNAGTPRLLFEGPYDQFFDVSPDGQRFAMTRRNLEQAAPQLNVVLNWFDEWIHRARKGQ